MPDRGLNIQNEDKLVSVTNHENIRIVVPPPGLRYEQAFFQEDTLYIVVSSRNSNENGNMTYHQMIPVTEISSVQILPGDRKLRFGSVGFGYGTGSYLSSGFTHMNNLAGMSISLRGLWYPATDLPDDYTGIFNNDNVIMFATMGVFGGKPDEYGNVWLGVEFGPSFVNYRKEVEIPNPDYGQGWLFEDPNKYLRENVVSNTIGLSGRVKFDYMFSDHAGLELALFANMNKYKPNFGFECHFIFGKLR